MATCVVAALAGATSVIGLREWCCRSAIVVVPAVAPAALREDAVERPDFGDTPVSADARRLAEWVTATADHGGRPFAIIDKTGATLYVFAPPGHLLGASPILVGLARGDDSVPGIGTRPIDAIRPEERTTPAGRFVAWPGRNSGGEQVVWVDYDDAISMHSVRPVVASEHRLERLASGDPAQHRISYGCINVPTAFFASTAGPAFEKPGGVIYVLPETRSLEASFPQFRRWQASRDRATTGPLAATGQPS